jgi:hypothetical protein
LRLQLSFPGDSSADEAVQGNDRNQGPHHDSMVGAFFVGLLLLLDISPLPRASCFCLTDTGRSVRLTVVINPQTAEGEKR